MKKVGYTVVILSLIFIMFSLYDFNFTSINTIDTQEIINHCNRIEEAEEFFNKFLDMADVQQVKIDRDANPYPGVNYYLVSDFNSLQELKSYILELYSLSVASEYYFKYFENPDYFENNSPLYIEIDNQLYCDTTRYGGRGGKNVYDHSSLNIVKSCTDTATVTIDYYFIMEPDVIKTKTISLIKENNSWVFNDFI